MGPSNTLAGGEIPVGAWRQVGGCEVGFTLPDPEDPDLVWAGCYDGILDLYDHRTGHSRNVSVWPQAVESRAAEDLKYRIQWTAPLAISISDINEPPSVPALFEIAGTELRLKMNAALDYETNPVLDVTVNVNDTSVGSTPDDTAPLAIPISRRPPCSTCSSKLPSAM